MNIAQYLLRVRYYLNTMYLYQYVDFIKTIHFVLRFTFTSKKIAKNVLNTNLGQIAPKN